MPAGKFEHVISEHESLMYQNPSNVTQRIESFVDDVEITLSNPHKIHNPTGSACLVMVKKRYDSGYTPVYLIAGGTYVCDITYVGKSTRGTTATDLVVDGVK